MPYQYGMQNSPSGGNGLGGLPKKQTTPTQVSFTRIVVVGSGTIVPPANAKYMRVAVIGGGGRGNVAGGGGGCAASKLVAAAPIIYTVGAGGTGVSPNGGTSSATFPGYSLIATGGSNIGGVGSGGDYNYRGGNVGSSNGAGGGAAGPFGNGANGRAAGLNGNGADAILGISGWGVAGGGGGGVLSLNGFHSGGGGTGAIALGSYPSGGGGFSRGGGSAPWGAPPQFSDFAGGVMGGGGGYITSVADGDGGVGGIVVEWFYD